MNLHIRFISAALLLAKASLASASVIDLCYAPVLQSLVESPVDFLQRNLLDEAYIEKNLPFAKRQGWAKQWTSRMPHGEVVYRGMRLTPKDLDRVLAHGLSPERTASGVIYLSPDPALAVDYAFVPGHRSEPGSVSRAPDHGFVSVLLKLDASHLPKVGRWTTGLPVPPEWIQEVWIFDKARQARGQNPFVLWAKSRP